VLCRIAFKDVRARARVRTPACTARVPQSRIIIIIIYACTTLRPNHITVLPYYRIYRITRVERFDNSYYDDEANNFRLSLTYAYCICSVRVSTATYVHLSTLYRLRRFHETRFSRTFPKLKINHNALCEFSLVFFFLLQSFRVNFKKVTEPHWLMTEIVRIQIKPDRDFRVLFWKQW